MIVNAPNLKKIIPPVPATNFATNIARQHEEFVSKLGKGLTPQL